ncbi:hypothetical protein vseg_007342 [Gypsophila vaccaria]
MLILMVLPAQFGILKLIKVGFQHVRHLLPKLPFNSFLVLKLCDLLIFWYVNWHTIIEALPFAGTNNDVVEQTGGCSLKCKTSRTRSYTEAAGSKRSTTNNVIKEQTI